VNTEAFAAEKECIASLSGSEFKYVVDAFLFEKLNGLSRGFAWLSAEIFGIGRVGFFQWEFCSLRTLFITALLS